MTSTSPTLAQRLHKYLPLAEKIFLGGVLIVLIMNSLKMDATSLLVPSLTGLAIVFFLSAYKPSDIPQEENKQLGFAELFGTIMLPKVMWISLAVSVIGIQFYVLGKVGYKEMLIIGGSSMSVALFLLLVLSMSDTKYLKNAAPILLRAIPALLVIAYLLFK